MRTWTTSLWLCTAYCSWLLSASCVGSEERQTPLVRAVKRAQVAVVNIHSEKTTTDKETVFTGAQPHKVNGMGTGIIIDERGYIVTNQHVIADVDSLRVTLHDGGTYVARVISYDRKQDLAIIKIDPTRPLEVIPLGTSSDLMLGETVIAVGNAFGYEHTVTAGIISSLSRDVEVNATQSYKNLLQTDASINPGNSGGPLLNLDGEVVGINVAIRAGAQRIGFAIPIDDARKLIAKLLNTGRLNDTYHGLITHDIKAASNLKLVVDSAEKDSPAALAGLKTGDVVTQADNIAVLDQADLERAILRHNAGESIDITVQRENEKLTMSLRLTKNPHQTVASAAAPIIRANNNAETVEEKSWRILGIRVAPIPAQQLGAFRTRYRGGMRILAVRPDSPASRNGIKTDDILVGLHVWETVNNENVAYVLSHPNLLNEYDPLKFYLLRGHETLFGHLRLVADRK